MKLIDLLVRELKCWPDDVHCMTQDSDGDLNWHNDNSAPELNDKGVTWKCDESWMDYHKGWEISDDWEKAIVTRDQYQSALAASQNVEWSGDGLPPVGVKCEIIINEGNLGLCEIIFVGQSLLVWRQDSTYQEGSGYHRHMKFRPLRSEEDKKRDAVAGKIFDVICKSLTDNSESTSFAIYDAIAAGEIPGVKLED